MKKPRRVFHPHRAGLFDPDAPFWRGERAEDIVRKRLKEYKRKKRRKRK